MECDSRAESDYKAADNRRLDRITKITELRRKYDSMLQAVNAWVPPSGDHVHLQEFMRKQITDSIDWDCDTAYCSSETPRLTGDQWIEQRREKVQRDIAYHEKEHKAESSVPISATSGFAYCARASPSPDMREEIEI